MPTSNDHLVYPGQVAGAAFVTAAVTLLDEYIPTEHEIHMAVRVAAHGHGKLPSGLLEVLMGANDENVREAIDNVVSTISYHQAEAANYGYNNPRWHVLREEVRSGIQKVLRVAWEQISEEVEEMPTASASASNHLTSRQREFIEDQRNTEKSQEWAKTYLNKVGYDRTRFVQAYPYAAHRIL